MVVMARSGKVTKFAGRRTKPQSSTSVQVSAAESAAFPSFEQPDDAATTPRMFLTSSSQLQLNNNISQPTPRKQSAPALLTRRPKKDMSIPDFYSSPPKADRYKAKPKVHIIPHRRKGSNTESTSLDLSISAIENEGLGIYTSYDRERRHADTFANTAALTAHTRSASGTSQNSVPISTSGIGRHGAQYVHPMRQTPRPYTPPLSRSNQTSLLGSEQSEAPTPTALDGSAASSAGREPFKFRSSSLGSHNHTEPRRSFNLMRDSPNIFQTPSQTNITGTGASIHSRTFDEASSPISRSSLDIFRSKGRAPTNSDPLARAAAVQAARQAFEDREAAKNRKLERAHDKELRKRERKELQHLEQSFDHPQNFAHPHRPNFSFRGSAPEKGPRTEHSGRRSNDLGGGVQEGGLGPGNGGSKRKNPKSAWLLFLTWLRTKLFKMGRKVKRKKKVG